MKRTRAVCRCQYYLAQSLDGYLAESDGGLDWLLRFGGEDEIDASAATDGAYDRFFADVGALAMGSATYEFILRSEPGSWPYAGTPSWVFSSRKLPQPERAEIRFASGPVGPVHEEMRAAAGERNVWIVGGGDLAMQFADEGLLDELHLTIVPVVLGAGIPTIPRRLRQRLRLAGTRPFRNGMVELRYELVR
ncbi:MAG TPA: dihydrofolate reductase family protein [Thermoleophilaceae bacterium]|nr:dihydrofolate reductase family protein [Thermoleophilaceae bacterium]